MEEVKQHIIGKAEELFLKYGIKSVTMDDIARELAISKKTIYQYFTDKNEIVNRVVHIYLEREKETMAEARRSAEDIIEECFLLSRCLRENHIRINPVVFWDMKKYYQKAWNLYQEYKNEIFFESIRQTLEKGIREGYFRESINPEILALLRLEQIQLIFNEDIFPRHKFNLYEIQEQLYNHFMYGLLTEKGKQAFEQYTSNYNAQ